MGKIRVDTTRLERQKEQEAYYCGYRGRATAIRTRKSVGWIIKLDGLMEFYLDLEKVVVQQSTILIYCCNLYSNRRNRLQSEHSMFFNLTLDSRHQPYYGYAGTPAPDVPSKSTPIDRLNIPGPRDKAVLGLLYLAAIASHKARTKGIVSKCLRYDNRRRYGPGTDPPGSEPRLFNQERH